MREPRIGRLYVDGKPHGNDQIFPLQQKAKKQLICQGIAAERIEIHYPVYPGVIRCQSCQHPYFRPQLKVYDGHEYFNCTICQKTNYVNNTSHGKDNS